MKLKVRKDQRQARHRRLRKKIAGTSERPRMAIARSNRSLFVQFIDDTSAVTLASASSIGEGRLNREVAGQVGRKAAEEALAKGIRQVVVDRGGSRFHGRIKAVVDAAVEGGLSITTNPTEAAHNEETK